MEELHKGNGLWYGRYMGTKRKPQRMTGRAVGYVRVSTADQANEGFSMDAQRRRIEAYCEAMGWELVEVFADAGISGTAAKRPAFDQMRQAVLADGIAHVVAIKLDRVGRSAKQLLDLYDELEREGVGIVCILDGIDTSTPVGRLMRTVLAAVAEFEHDTISQRVVEGMTEAKAQGKHVGRPVEMDPSTDARIVALRDAGHGVRVIASTLNDEGIPTTRGGQRWYPSTVAAAIKRLTPPSTTTRST